MIELFCEDCLAGLDKLDYADLIFFDPPYNAKKDYGPCKDNLPEEEYIRFMKEVIMKCKNLSRNGLGIYVDDWRLKLFWQTLFPEAEVIIIWKRTPGFKSKLNLLGCYHAILTNAKAFQNVKNLWSDIHPISDGFYYTIDKNEYRIKEHPSQTSLKATKRFIASFSEEEDLIVDPFFGIGTTAIACKDLNRKVSFRRIAI